jgi:hypothetical protein
MKAVCCLAIALSLSGCALYNAGEDPTGEDLRDRATPVLMAIRDYIDQTSRIPKSLDELVPRYLKALPDKPKVTLDAKRNLVYFTYNLTGKSDDQVECSAAFGQSSWDCSKYYGSH